jgi:hypothetical protein
MFEADFLIKLPLSNADDIYEHREYWLYICFGHLLHLWYVGDFNLILFMEILNRITEIVKRLAKITFS